LASRPFKRNKKNRGQKIWKIKVKGGKRIFAGRKVDEPGGKTLGALGRKKPPLATMELRLSVEGGGQGKKGTLTSHAERK